MNPIELLASAAFFGWTFVLITRWLAADPKRPAPRDYTAGVVSAGFAAGCLRFAIEGVSPGAVLLGGGVTALAMGIVALLASALWLCARKVSKIG